MEVPTSSAVGRTARSGGWISLVEHGFRRNRRWATPLLSVVIFLGAWQLVGSHVNPLLFATPVSVVSSWVTLMRGGILEPAWIHAMEALVAGLALASVVGITMGIFMGRSDTVYRAINPFISFFMSTPLIALVPLVVIWVGIGYPAEITVTFMIAVWSIMINTAEGVRVTPVPLLEMAHVYRVPERSVVRYVSLPYAVPYIYAGIRVAVGKSFVGVIIAEMDITLHGLGGLIVQYGDAFDTSALLAVVISSSVAGVIIVIALDLLRRYTTPWAASQSDGGKRS